MTTTIPATDLMLEVLGELARTAQAAGDKANANALNKAAYEVAGGLAFRVDSRGDLLIPSRSTAGTVYRVTRTGCGCEAGANGKPCWHGAVLEALAVAIDLAAELADDAAAADDVPVEFYDAERDTGELGFWTDAAGVRRLPADAPVGTSIVSWEPDYI